MTDGITVEIRDGKVDIKRLGLALGAEGGGVANAEGEMVASPDGTSVNGGVGARVALGTRLGITLGRTDCPISGTVLG